MRKIAAGIADTIGTLLRAKRARLLEEVRGAPGQVTGDSTPGPIGPRDEVQAALLRRKYWLLAEIDAALERLNRGTYGFCRRCGEFIGLARLKALPFAGRCASCLTRAVADACLTDANQNGRGTRGRGSRVVTTRR